MSDTRHANTLAFVHASLDEVRAAVQAAQTMLDKGQPVDLVAVDTRVVIVCAKALDLPLELGRMALPELIMIRDEVDTLFETFIRRRVR